MPTVVDSMAYVLKCYTRWALFAFFSFLQARRQYNMIKFNKTKQHILTAVPGWYSVQCPISRRRKHTPKHFVRLPALLVWPPIICVPCNGRQYNYRKTVMSHLMAMNSLIVCYWCAVKKLKRLTHSLTHLFTELFAVSLVNALDYQWPLTLINTFNNLNTLLKNYLQESRTARKLWSSLILSSKQRLQHHVNVL